MQRLTFSLKAFVAAAGLLLWSAAANATTQTGQITVTVKDQSGVPQAGIELKLSSPDLIGGERKVATDVDGTFRFIQLPPGKYTVVCETAEFRPVRSEGIEVRINSTTNVDLVLEPLAGGDVQEIVVVGTKPTVDTEKLTMGATISDSVIETIPNGRDYQSMATIAPGVVDNGSGNHNIMGGTMYGNQWLLDGINITDPVTNTFAVNFNFDAIKEVEVLTGGRDAEYGAAAGGVMNIVTESGGNKYTADASIYFQSEKLQMLEADEKDRKNRSLAVNINLGGPIIEDKLWFFFSGEVPWGMSTFKKPDEPIFNDMRDKSYPSRDFLAFYGLLKLTWQATENTTIKALFQGNPTRINNTMQDPSTHPKAERQRLQGGYIAALTADTFLNEDMFWTNRLAYLNTYIINNPMSGDYDLAGHNDFADGTSTVNDSGWYEDSRNRLQLHSALSYSLADLLGEHQFKFGLDATLSWSSTFDSYTGGGVYTDNKGAPYRYEKLIEAQDTSIWSDSEGIFAQDVWKPLSNVTLRPGLRFDSARLRNWDNETQVAVNCFSPRFGVAWDPFGEGRMSIRGGYFMYVDTGFLTLSDFAGGKSKLTRTYEYNDATGQYDQFVYESGGASSVEGKDYLKDAWNQQRPRTHELMLGFGIELTENLALNVDGTYRYTGNMWEDDESNAIWNDSGTDVIGFANGQPEYIYSLGAMKEAFIEYWGLQVSLTKEMADKWFLEASYVLSQTKGTETGMIGIAFDRPANREYEYGYLPQDVRHQLKIDTSYEFPYGLVLGAQIRYFSGSPYNRMMRNEFYSDYSDRRAPRGYDIDGEELRMEDLFYASARVTWRLEEIIDHRIDLIAEVSNLLNNRQTTSIETRNLPAGSPTQFGDELDNMAPLSVMLGLRYRYD